MIRMSLRQKVERINHIRWSSLIKHKDKDNSGHLCVVGRTLFYA